MIKKLLFATLCFLFFYSCGDDEPKDTVTTLQVKTEAKSRAITIVDSKGNSFTLTEAKLGIRHVEFETAQDSSYKITGPFIVDLMNGSATPAIKTMTIPSGSYSRVDIRIDDTDDDFPGLSQDDPLFSYSFYGKGTYGDKPFVIQLKFNEDVRFDFQDALQVSAETTNSFKLSLEASEWFAQLDLTDCIDEISGNDTLVISESGTCSDVEGALKTAIKTMYDFEKQ